MTRAGTRGMPRAQRESGILDAAVTEFGRTSYAGTTTAAIAATADVSKPLVLRYFGSKEDLYIACARRAGENLTTHIEAVLDAGEPTLATAAQTLAAIFAALEERPHDWTVLHDKTVPRGSAARTTARDFRHQISGQAVRGVAGLVANTPDLETTWDVDDIAVLSELWISSVTTLVDWWLKHPDQTAAQMTNRSYRILTTITRLGSADT